MRLSTLAARCAVLPLVAAAGPALATAGTLDFLLAPVADTTIFADVTGDNLSWDDVSDGQGDSLWLSTTAGGVLRRSLVRFDLTTLPQGMQVVSATLTLWESRSRDEHDVSLHRMLAPWGEGLSDGGGQGEGAPATAGDATWRWREYQVSAWSQRGGDFVASASAVSTVGAPNSFYVWDSTPALVADVAGWIADPAANHGWILLGSEVDAQNAKRFASGEWTVDAQRPMLAVTLAPVPEAPAALMLAAGLLLLMARRRAA